MPQESIPLESTSQTMRDLYSAEMTFGEFMRAVRKAKQIPLRALAKAVNKTATYMSDIENGNNRPPDKRLLDAILAALSVNDNPNLCEKLYDLAALGRGDIPADIKSFIVENPDAISILRLIASKPNRKEVLAELTAQYDVGGIKDDS